MAEHTNIQWCDHTFNPWWGCTKVSPGCTNCYAEALDRRTGGDHWGVGKARRRTSHKNWGDPLRWNAAAQKAGVRRRVFCASMADWLDDAVPVDWLADLLGVIERTSHLDWLMLTKRPENWRERLDEAHEWLRWGNDYVTEHRVGEWLKGTAPPNVWVGTTVEDQRRADERIPALLDIPARVRFLSCEPLLEGVALSDSLGALSGDCGCSLCEEGHTCSRGREVHPGIDWVIVGGESGPGARPFHVKWAASIIAQCQAAGVACFVKQLGAHVRHAVIPPNTVRVRYSDRKGADPAEWPADLRIRQFPTPRSAC